jgi:enamine deaminase RidA (YjgF/YER057c/UK114 family)
MTDRVHSGSPYEARYGFCRARRVGDRIEVAGTAPVPAPGDTVATTAHDQLLRCGDIALAAMTELGAAASDIVRTRMFITDPADADEVGRAHATLFGEAEPVATMVVVAALLDPSWKVELEVEAQLHATAAYGRGATGRHAR